MQCTSSQPESNQLTPNQLAELRLEPERVDEHYLESFSAEALAPDEFIAEGASVIERAMNAGCEPRRLLVCDDELFLDDVRAFRARYPHVPGRVATRERMAELIGMNRLRGMLVVCGRLEPSPTQELLASATRLLVLEHVSIPGMQGSLIRTAAALGIDGVLLGAGCADPYVRRELRASMGNLFLVPWCQWDAEGRELLDELGRTGFTCVRLTTQAVPAGLPLRELRIDQGQRVALVIDLEGLNSAIDISEATDLAVYVPTATERGLSLDTAAALAMWKLHVSG